MSLNVTRTNDLAPASHEEAPAPDEKLSDRQLLAIDLILAGRPDTHVAQAIGVSRRTIIRWRLSDADVIAELRRRRRQPWQGTADRLRAVLRSALDVLAEQLTDRVDRHRFRAATTILRLANVKSAVPVEAEEEGE